MWLVSVVAAVPNRSSDEPPRARADTRFRHLLQRLLQYSLRVSVHLSPGSRRLTPTLSRVLAGIGLVSAVRRLFALSQLGASFLRSLVALTSPAPSSTPIRWPRTSQFDRVWLLGLAREALEGATTLADASYLLTSHALLAPVFRPRRVNPNRLDQLASLSDLLSAGVGLWETKEVRTRTWIRGRAIRREALAVEGRLKNGHLWTGDEHDEAERKEGRRWEEMLKVHQRQLRGLRAELVDLDWEKVRLWAEAVFAGESRGRTRGGTAL